MTAPPPIHRVRLRAPEVGIGAVSFEWDVTPSTALYQAHGFRLDFPPDVDLEAVPASLWLRLALICLHPHWALLRPCRVELPYYLGPAEREFWLRMIDLAAFQNHARGRPLVPGRAADIVDDGPAATATEIRARRGVAAAFSGGKDSLVQASLLSELSERPLLVTTTSAVPWARDHAGAARSYTLGEVQRRLNVDLVEVRSDFRACWRNEFSGQLGCDHTVNEVSDVLLYQASTLAVAAAAGIGRALMASEAELQYNNFRCGDVVLHGHYASGAVVHMALSAVLRPFGLSLGSLTYPLHMPQVQGLLWRRYRPVTDLQFSCWQATGGERACSSCAQCLEVALVILNEGYSPTSAGIDPLRLFSAFSEPPWSVTGRPSPAALPSHPFRSGRDKFVRTLKGLPPEKVAEILSADPDCPPGERFEAGLDAYRRLRSRALPLEPPPEPGYVESFLAFIEPDLRHRVRSIYAGYFPAADEDEFSRIASRARSVARWVAAPLAPRPPRLRDPDRRGSRS